MKHATLELAPKPEHLAQNDVLLDPNAEAALLGVNVGTLADWRFKHQGPPYIKVGRLCRYPLAATRRWMEARTVTPEGPEAA